MKIRFRDPTLSYPIAIRDDKTLIVLEWLLEFRFSTYDVLSSRIDSNSTNSNRFFRMLVERKMIKSFKSAYATGRKFVMLDLNGIGFLESKGRPVGKAVTRESRLGNYSNLMHDIAIQNIVLEAINSRRSEEVHYVEVLWDRNIDNLDNDVRPDAMLKTSKGKIVCFEIERFRKELRKVYYKYRLHAESILEGRYNGVFYFFLNKSDKIYYERLAGEDSWPFVVKDKKARGKLTQKTKGYIPSEKSRTLHKCFSFVHSPSMDLNNIA